MPQLIMPTPSWVQTEVAISLRRVLVKKVELVLGYQREAKVLNLSLAK